MRMSKLLKELDKLNDNPDFLRQVRRDNDRIDTALLISELMERVEKLEQHLGVAGA